MLIYFKKILEEHIELQLTKIILVHNHKYEIIHTYDLLIIILFSNAPYLFIDMGGMGVCIKNLIITIIVSKSSLEKTIIKNRDNYALCNV